MKKNLRVKLALLFLLVMAAASTFTFLVSIIFTSREMIYEVIKSQNRIAITMSELHEKTDLSIEEIIRLSLNNNYYAVKLEDLENLNLGNSDLSRLKNKEIVFVRKSIIPIGKTYLYLDNQLIEISIHAKSSTFRSSSLRIGLILFLCILIGTIIISAASKRVLSRIQNLNEATKQVAKGNFDIKIDKFAEDEIGQLTESFNKMVKELKGIELLRQDFISNVSHEFKTPIASIQGFAKLLQSDLSEEDRREYMDIIVNESERLSRMSSIILKLSKLENQEIIVEKTIFSLDEQIRRSILLLESEWSRKNINFNIELEGIQYRGSEELLQQVWLNLLSNAIKFSEQNGEITVKLYNTTTSIKTRIIDKGIGMSESTMERIFEKFYQGDSAHSSEGTGLGLPLVKRIIELCGGKIYVKSQKERGSTFTVELPPNKDL